MTEGQQVCRQVGSCLYNHTAAVWVYYVCADLGDSSSWKIQVEVWKCVSGHQGGFDGARMQVLRKQNVCSDKFDYVRASVPQCYNCSYFSVNVYVFLWEQHPIITSLDCWLLVLHGLWRCTWVAAHTCLIPAQALNWLKGSWVAPLSKLHPADYSFPCFIMFLHL